METMKTKLSLELLRELKSLIMQKTVNREQTPPLLLPNPEHHQNTVNTTQTKTTSGQKSITKDRHCKPITAVFWTYPPPTVIILPSAAMNNEVACADGFTTGASPGRTGFSSSVHRPTHGYLARTGCKLKYHQGK